MGHAFEVGALVEHHNVVKGRRRHRSGCTSPVVCAALGCRVLVSKERLEQKWPTEKDGAEGEAFRKFAARLADAVQKALAEGKIISDGTKVSPIEKPEYCPLGCLPEAAETKPVAYPSYWIDGKMPLASFLLKDFYRAFDGVYEGGRTDSPYYLLGLEYRKRFVTKGG